MSIGIAETEVGLLILSRECIQDCYLARWQYPTVGEIAIASWGAHCAILGIQLLLLLHVPLLLLIFTIGKWISLYFKFAFSLQYLYLARVVALLAVNPLVQ
jgi:hypothetical protein